MSDFKDKFIGFVDILGFKEMIEHAELGSGRTLAEIDEILAELGRGNEKARFADRGPRVCPESRYVQRDLDFEATQVSDCVIVSAEVSPAGVINLVNHCWSAAIMLLIKGVMVRGYITRGNIHHEGTKFRGTGYQSALEKESGVKAFKKEADEKGTPFIEIDGSVTAYVDNETDWCVREMFGRYVKRDAEVTAIFPFQRLSHSFIIAGLGVKFDPERERRNNDNVRKAINRFKDALVQYVAPDNDEAMRKVRHYIEALDAQLVVCDHTDEIIDSLKGRPLPK